MNLSTVTHQRACAYKRGGNEPRPRLSFEAYMPRDLMNCTIASFCLPPSSSVSSSSSSSTTTTSTHYDGRRPDKEENEKGTQPRLTTRQEVAKREFLKLFRHTQDMASVPGAEFARIVYTLAEHLDEFFFFGSLTRNGGGQEGRSLIKEIRMMQPTRYRDDKEGDGERSDVLRGETTFYPNNWMHEWKIYLIKRFPEARVFKSDVVANSSTASATGALAGTETVIAAEMAGSAMDGDNKCGSQPGGGRHCSLEFIVSTLVHEMIHVYLLAYGCSCALYVRADSHPLWAPHCCYWQSSCSSLGLGLEGTLMGKGGEVEVPPDLEHHGYVFVALSSAIMSELSHNWDHSFEIELQRPEYTYGYQMLYRYLEASGAIIEPEQYSHMDNDTLYSHSNGHHPYCRSGLFVRTLPDGIYIDQRGLRDFVFAMAPEEGLSYGVWVDIVS
ncbi:hypothetical protein F5Y17DRAFT_460798 [Xylariaceae sp. FL0594]|nr:hypothetical protein F5Y17DRAFT_460798 [Xylariaceae sp. FL0594]